MDDPVQTRRQRQQRVEGFTFGGVTGRQRPPFRFSNCDMLWVTATMDPEAIRTALPPQLTPAESNTGVHLFWQSREASPFGPTGGYLVGIEVEGFDGPGGFPAHYLAAAYYTDPFASVVCEIFVAAASSASTDSQRAETHHEVRVGEDAHELCRVSVSTTPASIDPNGTVIYIATAPGDELVVFDTPWDMTGANARRSLGTSAEYVLGPAASPLLQSLAPREIVYVLSKTGMDFSWGIPRPVARRAPLDLAVLQAMGRAAAIIDKNLELLEANGRAHAALGPDFPRKIAEGDRTALMAAAEAAFGRAHGSDPVPVTLHDGTRGFARVIALSPASASRALLIVQSSDRPAAADPAATLQRLGLTPAETRMALAVGRGSAPRQAAQALAVTEATARSTLKLVYDKLDLKRQSDLVQLVTVLDRF